jgi:hypothetical protein
MHVFLRGIVEVVSCQDRFGCSTAESVAHALTVLMVNKYTRSFIKYDAQKYIVNLNIEYGG